MNLEWEGLGEGKKGWLWYNYVVMQKIKWLLLKILILVLRKSLSTMTVWHGSGSHSLCGSGHVFRLVFAWETQEAEGLRLWTSRELVFGGATSILQTLSHTGSRQLNILPQAMDRTFKKSSLWEDISDSNGNSIQFNLNSKNCKRCTIIVNLLIWDLIIYR